MTTPAYQNAEQRYANLENTLGNFGYVPVVSSFTGPARAIYGIIQTIVGSVTSVFKGVQYFITRDPEHRNQAAANHWYTVHGNMNITRGSIEFMPVFGNLATFFYDTVIGLRANYTYEKLPSGVDPLFESKSASAPKSSSAPKAKSRPDSTLAAG